MSNCPICEQPIPGTSEHCDVCGFPTGLAIEALRAARTSGPDTVAAPGPPLSSAPSPKPRPPPPPEAELTATIGRGLRHRMEALRPLGRDAPDVTSEMCEAALGEAGGRVAESLEILRAAQGRLDRQVRDTIRRRWEAATDRRQALERTGVRLDLDLPPLPEDGSGLDGAEATDARVAQLLDVEQRLGRFESDWKGLQGLLAQIEGLRSEGAELGLPLADIPEQIGALRAKLTEGTFREAELDAASQDAARILMLLHEALPTSLEEELRAHRAAIDRWPEEHPAGERARKIHEEATHHLARGRLVEAAQSVRDLRRALEEAQHPATAPARPAPPPAAGPPDEALLQVLLKKARSLAGRVRSLPADSALALEAAAEIREATDQLRAGRLADADRTLTDLMRTLAREEAGA